MRQCVASLGCLILVFSCFQLSVAESGNVFGNVASGVPIEGGHVVVGGNYIDGPYVVTEVDGAVLINDVQVATLNADATEYGVSTVASLERCLYRGHSLVVFDDRTRLILDSMETSSFWQSLLEAKTLDERVQVVFGEADYDTSCADSIPTSQWRQLLQDFKASPSLDEYVASIRPSPESSDEITCTRDAPLASQTLPSGSIVYVLNTVGMLLAVISFGVLIKNPPTKNAAWGMISDSEDALGLTKKCVTLSVVLSVFDLVSTVAAASIAEYGFIELNPLAASFIDSPSLLTVAKLFGTGLSAGLLWSQRQYAGAQQASWWICFVLTLLTARWVVVDSLFVC